MKIVAVVGSNHKNSITYQLTKQILTILEIEYGYLIEIIWLQEYPVNYCIGCNLCFQTGSCPLDKTDAMQLIKNILEDSDCILFSSPVYAHACSGIMKTFIDRICSICHVMGYAGKLGFTIATTEITGAGKVSTSLSDFQISLGIKNLKNFMFYHTSDSPQTFVKNTAAAMHHSVTQNYGWSYKTLEDVFRQYKNIYVGNREEELWVFEKEYWNQTAVKQCKSFQEFAMLQREK